MSKDLNIRPTSEDDIAALQDIEISAGKAFLKIDGLQSLGADSCAAQEQHLAAIATQTSWIAEVRGRAAAGFLAGSPVGSSLHVDEISVRSDYQKQGIGRALMEHAEAQARWLGLSELTLTTFRHVNWNAPFYEKLGFQILSEEDLCERLAGILAMERALGLPAPEQRCAMQKRLR